MILPGIFLEDFHNCIPFPKNQDHGKGGLSLGGVAVMTENAMTATTAKTVETATVASLC